MTAYDPEYISVDGIAIDLAIPFVGESVLFYCHGSAITFSTYPKIEIQGQYIYLHFESELREGTENAIFANVCSHRDNAINLLRGGIGILQKDIDKFNSNLRDNALTALRKKKSKVSSLHKLSELLEVPVQQTEYAKTHITVQRRIQAISHTNNPEPQYTISDSVYDDILRTIKHIGSSIEQTPASYKSMKEEALRDVVLGNLNTIYLGRTSGEAFRVGGKTDICIEEKNRAAFVVECKIWDGSKTIGEAIDQLDNYTTWRDCKTAIIIFVRKKDFLAIVDKAKATLEALPNIRYVKVKDKNEFDCSYNSKVTHGQIIKMRCFLFNVEPGISKR